jgi:hypothetical protein
MFGEASFTPLRSSIDSGLNGTASLQSWKEISLYTGSGIRTLQRWERSNGFPIRRPSGIARSAVFAMRSEVDAWLLARGCYRQLKLFTGSPSLTMQQAAHPEREIRKMAVGADRLRTQLLLVQQERNRLHENTSTLKRLVNSVKERCVRGKRATAA